jgi:predicted transcriptional regulator
MTKRTFQEIRKALLIALSDGKEHSYGSLERKVNTNWQSIRDHCKDLQIFNAVNVSENGVKITKEGRELLKKL